MTNEQPIPPRLLVLLDTMRATPAFGGLPALRNGKVPGIASLRNIISWLVAQGHVRSASEASSTLQELVSIGGLSIAGTPGGKAGVSRPGASSIDTAGTLYRHNGLTAALRSRGRVIRGAPVLNAFLAPEDAARCIPTRPLSDVLTDLGEAFASLCGGILSAGGHEVDYGAVLSHPAWPRVLACEAQLAVADNNIAYVGKPATSSGSSSSSDVVEPPALAEHARKAALFNLYNVMIIHAKIVYGAPSGLRARSKFFARAAYTVGGGENGGRVDSGALEHLVLRCKATDPGRNGAAAYTLRLARRDPRMHFVLNCGARSCPAIRPIALETAEEDIAAAAANFINKEVRIGRGKRSKDAVHNAESVTNADSHSNVSNVRIGEAESYTVRLSRLFKWFRNDFTPGSESDAELLAWIARNAPTHIRERLEVVVAEIKGAPENTRWKLKFDKYDWADNGDWNAPKEDGLMFIYDAAFAREK